MSEVRPKKTQKAKKTPAPSRVRVSAKKASAAKEKKTSGEITLPKNMPLRTKEKAAVYRVELAELWDPAMIRIAMVAGFCFVVFGASLSLLDTFKGVPLTAQLSSSTEYSTTSSPLG